ncbi:MAG TPA: hypothetical protein VEC06_03520 [Paucimonas sp.]|nr:hypothetical protein [Paucimonas sp.]
MTVVTTVPAVDGFVVPSLAKLAARLARPAAANAKDADLRRAAGLSIADISDASLRATAKGSLRIRRDICRPAYAI